MYVICLTWRHLRLLRQLIDEPAQLAQPIGTEGRVTGADRDYEVGLENIRPLDRERPQPPAGAGIRDAVAAAAPVAVHGEQVELLPS